MNDRVAWDKLMEDIKVPGNSSDRLWLAFQTKPSTPDILRDSKNLSSVCPSIDEFRKYIKSLDSVSAAGASGLSYLMVKLWPDDFVTRAYDFLCEAWLDKKGLE